MSVTGLCYININGQRVHSQPDATLRVGGKIAKSAMSVLGFVGQYTDEIQAAQVKFKMIHTGNIDVTTMQQLREQTVVFETDSGQRYLLRNAGTVDAVELSKNVLDVTMEGAPAELV